MSAMTSHTSEFCTGKWRIDQAFTRNESECTNCASRLSALASVMTWEQVISHLTSLAQGELFCDMDNSFWDIEVTLHLVTAVNTPFAEPGVSG